ncbi:MAG: hypothetical protein ACRBBP_01640 [Bdellovibrionales bacterium]
MFGKLFKAFSEIGVFCSKKRATGGEGLAGKILVLSINKSVCRIRLRTKNFEKDIKREFLKAIYKASFKFTDFKQFAGLLSACNTYK